MAGAGEGLRHLGNCGHLTVGASQERSKYSVLCTLYTLFNFPSPPPFFLPFVAEPRLPLSLTRHFRRLSPSAIYFLPPLCGVLGSWRLRLPTPFQETPPPPPTPVRSLSCPPLGPNSISCVSRPFLLCCVWPAWPPSLSTAMRATTPISKASR